MYYYNGDAGWNSEYDSTWEDDELEPPKKKKQKPQYQRNFGSRAARDMQNYRHGYGQPIQDPNSLDYDTFMPNLEFYQNKMPFQPHGVTIEDFHQDWREDYDELEESHSFIQWLFPLREHGVNPYAFPLTLAEIEMMKADKDVMRRFLESYKLMLGFYGIQLLDAESGLVSRAQNWKERYRNLNNRGHNNLRITRILKCLGEMGSGHLQAPLVRFFLEETLCNNYLPNVERSALDYFMFTVRDKQERRKLVLYAWENYKSQEPFLWGPVETLRNFTFKQEDDNGVEQPETGGGLEEEDGKVVTDVTASSRQEKLMTEDNSSDNEKQAPEEDRKMITEDNSSDNEIQAPEEDRKLITEDNSSEDEKQAPEDGKLITEDNSIDKEKQAPKEDEKLITEDNSSDYEKQAPEEEKLITEDNSSRNEKQAPEEDRKLIKEDNSLRKHKQTQEDISLDHEKQITEDTSSEKDKLITEDNSSKNEVQTIKNTSSGNEKQTPEDKSSDKAKQKTEDNSFGNEMQITENNSSGNAKQITEDYSTGYEWTTESSSFINHKTLADTHLGNERLTTESTSFGNENTTTGGTGLGNKTQTRQSGVYQTEAPKAEEEHTLLSDNMAAREVGLWDWILSLGGFCCVFCSSARCT